MLVLEDTQLGKIVAEVNAADDGAFKPTKPVARGERVVGECTVTMKKLFNVLTLYDQASDQAKLDIKFAEQTQDDDAQEKAEAHFQQTLALYEIYHNLFWHEIKGTLGLYEGCHNIGIRKGWVIVQLKDTNSGALKTLRQILEG